MKGRMFVVDEKTLITTQRDMVASIRIPKTVGEQWLKTVADIMADMLQIEVGDYIFLWETRNKNQKSKIYGVYRAISKPFYKYNNKEDDAPFKIYIEKAYDFSEPIDEYDVLNCPYIKNTLWTIIGKKVAGKSRGTSPLSIEEIRQLIILLIGKNPNYVFEKQGIIKHTPVPALQISYSNVGTNKKEKSFTKIYPNSLNYFNDKYQPYFEKIIETVFNQELTNKNKKVFTQIGVDVEKVIWFSNYLPYSIEQSEMDYVIIESEDNMAYTKIFLIEFMKKSIDSSHILRSFMYSMWINDTLALGTSIVQPIVICEKSYDFNKEEKDKRKIQ